MQGKELFVIRAANAGDLAAAVKDAIAHGASALNDVLGSPMLHLNRHVIIDETTALRLPAIFRWPETAEEGGLLGYGPGFVELFRQRAGMVGKIPRGTKPSDLPVEQSSTFKLLVNLKTAKAIGLKIPSHFSPTSARGTIHQLQFAIQF